MISIQKLLFVLAALNITILIGFHVLRRDTNKGSTHGFLREMHSNEENQNGVIKISKIHNPFVLLDAYKKIDPSYFNRGDSKQRYDQVTYGLFDDNDYCEQVDLYNLAYPADMLKNKIFFTDYPIGSVPREAIKKAGNTVMKHISIWMPKKDASVRQFHLDKTINNFYTIMGGFHEYHEINKNFLCPTQMYSHIPGNGVMFRKDLVLEKLSAYREKYQDRPQCFNQSQFFLPYYRLFNKEECLAFFDVINSESYKNSLANEPVQYLIKQGHGAHKSLGVNLLDEKETVSITNKYENGNKCGIETDALIAQKYITNPMLLDLDNKFDFRIYMLIASTNPLIIYYHDGYLRVSVNSFDMNSKDRATHLTNTYLAEKKFAEARTENKTINGMTAKELEEYHLWDFDRLKNYLLESGKITDPDWLDNYLRPLFQKAFTHLIKMSSDGFWKESNVYELHGLDFMLDTNFNLWFIESNPNPLLIGVKPKLIAQMLGDLFEIQYAYYRSRMQRVVQLVERMEQDVADNGSLDIGQYKKEYKEAWANKLEPEYNISSNNTFVLVMDESRPKEGAYLGHIPSECVAN